MKIRSMGARRKDGQTDMTKLVIALHSCENAPKKLRTNMHTEDTVL